MSLLSDCFLSNGWTIACLSSAGMTAFSSEALVTYVMIGTVMPRILEISTVVVDSNTSMDAVKQRVSPGFGSIAVVRCKLTSHLSIFSFTKRENVSQPSIIEQNWGSCNRWT